MPIPSWRPPPPKRPKHPRPCRCPRWRLTRTPLDPRHAISLWMQVPSVCLCVCVFKYHDCMLKLLRCVSSYCIYQSYIARWWSIMSKLFFIISKTYYCVFICVPLLGLCTLSTTCLYHTLAQQGLLSSYIDIVGKKLDRADEMMETWSVYGRRISSGSYIHNTC